MRVTVSASGLSGKCGRGKAQSVSNGSTPTVYFPSTPVKRVSRRGVGTCRFCAVPPRRFRGSKTELAEVAGQKPYATRGGGMT